MEEFHLSLFRLAANMRYITIDWWANCFVFLSGFIIASGFVFYGFCTMIVGNLLFMRWAIREKRLSFIVFNFFYIVNTVYGIIQWSGTV